MSKTKKSKKKILGILIGFLILGAIFSDNEVDNKSNAGVNNTAEVTITPSSGITSIPVSNETAQDETEQDVADQQDTEQEVADQQDTEQQSTEQQSTEQVETQIPEAQLSNDQKEAQVITSNDETLEYNGVTYKIIEVYGGSLSGERQANVAVDIGFGDRVYWALTNEYGQLVKVIADKIVLQDDSTEPVNSDGRYYDDEAKVPGTEQADLDEGHVIADSLGGVSNAYNITPQNSTLNRHGDQAYMEKVIRDAGGCENFVATITYPNTTTQIPSKYKYEYVLKGNKIVDEFENVNPDEVNSAIEKQEQTTTAGGNKTDSGKDENKVDSSKDENKDLSKIDTNGNGKVTIAEAKAAGFSMPIYSDHWLYEYMDDRDGDGMVGE